MTNNGFDPRWVSAINGVLADRETNLYVSDMAPALWDRFIGPMVDHIEDTADLPMLERDFELASDATGTDEVSIVLSYKPEQDFLIDALTHAVEGGINYWAAFLEVKREDAHIPRVLSITIVDAEDPEAPQHTLTARDLARGIEILLGPSFRINGAIRAAVLSGLVNNDAGDIDADAADAIVQAAIFGSLVYG